MSDSKTDKQWQAELDPQTYRVCRLGETEAPFSGALLHNRQSGYYHCACCQSPLFYSDAKFDSGCGWPSFDRPIHKDAIRYIDDHSHGMERIEVRCQHCDAHLGHVFDDGPTDTSTRYCVNSAAMSFQNQDNKER
ncbi:peptide-methionine (R)-S-oxide reductase MsrB [Celerinatantimonas yamalensis]|uniref:Peptide methionine sulfoxide reductase MsrB n=1 Tax=Celerinatantimonas yamalensis TaxID=559956 RepID=A0ABW9G1G9_9GAMM